MGSHEAGMTPLRDPSQVEGAACALALVLAAALSCGCMCSRICNTLADETMATATSHSALRIFMMFLPVVVACPFFSICRYVMQFSNLRCMALLGRSNKSNACATGESRAAEGFHAAQESSRCATITHVCKKDGRPNAACGRNASCELSGTRHAYHTVNPVALCRRWQSRRHAHRDTCGRAGNGFRN